MNLFSKIKWILGILLVFLLILATNLIDRNNFVKVKDSVSNIYEDRLIAKNIIFDISKSVHQKEIALAKSDTSFYQVKNDNINNTLKGLTASFEETELTNQEELVFKDLVTNLEKLVSLENQFVQSDFSSTQNLEQQIQLIKTNLNDLSSIQIAEGNKQLMISQRAIENVELFTQMEIYILIFLAILIQIIVIYKPKK